MIFNLLWVGALTLIGVGAINYAEASTSSWLTLAIGLVIFNMVGLVALTKKRSSDASFIGPTQIGLVSRSQLLALTALYGVGVIVYLQTIDTRFGLDMLINDPSQIRGADGESYLESVPIWARFLLYIGPTLIGLFGYKNACTKPLPALLRFALLGAVGVSQIAMLQRTNLFMGVLFLIALLLSDAPSEEQRINRRRRTRVTISLVVLAVALFASFQYIANSLGKTGTSHAQSLASDWVTSSGLYSPIFYYTSGPVALLQLMDSTNTTWPEETSAKHQNIGDYNPQTWGAATFRPVLQIIPVATAFPSPSPFITLADGLYTNVYTWFEPAYRDFRLGGIVVFAAVMGWMLTRLHSTRFQSLQRFWVQGWLLAALFMSTFVSKLVTPLYLADLVLLALLAAWRSHRGKADQKKAEFHDIVTAKPGSRTR